MDTCERRRSLIEAVEIAGRQIGPGCPCLVIAEAGVNHNGDPELARKLVEAAVEARADVIKFQTFKAERLVTPGSPKAKYQMETTAASESQYEMLERLELAPEIHVELISQCRRAGIIFLSTPFDEESADYLDSLDVPAFKIPSGEITNLPFLAHVARKGRPMIVSTGMSNLGEVEAAIRTISEHGAPGTILLHCVSNYPADPADANLRAMATMQSAFGTPVGFSDHTPGLEVSLAAVALGACVIEKHFTLDRNLPGPDHRASIEPDQLRSLVVGTRIVEAALGDGRKVSLASEADTKAVARKSIVAKNDIPAGSMLGYENVAVLRPGTGLPPSLLPQLVGRKSKVHIPAGTVIRLEMLI